MLTIEIVNDGTANTPENTASDGIPFVILGNYDYKIFINGRRVGKGRIEQHLRTSGWQGLISCLNRVVNGDRFEN